MLSDGPISAKRYCAMLFHEEGDEMLRSIAGHATVSPTVRQFCLSILELVQQEGFLRGDAVPNAENAMRLDNNKPVVVKKCLQRWKPL